MKAEIIGLIVAGAVGVCTLVESKLKSEPKYDTIVTVDVDSTLVDSVKLELVELKEKNDSAIISIKNSNYKLKNTNKHISKDLIKKIEELRKMKYEFQDEEYPVQLEPKTK